MSQIKTALSELERGNVSAFQMGGGKDARRAEKELAQQFKAQMRLSSAGLVSTPSGSAGIPTAAVKVDDKYAYMATAGGMASAGSADAAWDD